MAEQAVKSKKIKKLIDWVLSILVALILTLFIMGNVGFLTKVSGLSMEPTFEDNDNAILNRLVYRFNKPQKGEIIVLNQNKTSNNIIYNMYEEGRNVINGIEYKLGINAEVNEDNMIKRIVATEGDLLEIRDGSLYVNGNIEELKSKKGMTYELIEISYPITIPKDHVFVMGDNREKSYDSRVMGPIKLEQIKGRVDWIILPLDRAGKISGGNDN